MGWWGATVEGHSFDNESPYSWGDGPADIMGDAIAKIEKEFEQTWNRKPYREELIAGLLFSINVDYPETKENK